MKIPSPTPIEALRTAAKGKAFDGAKAESDIEAAVTSANTRARVHDYRVRPREVLRSVDPLLNHLRTLGERLDAMDGDSWLDLRDWCWAATDDAEQVARDLGEAEQTTRDLRELRAIVARVEPRLQAVAEAMNTTNGRGGRPPNDTSRHRLFHDLRTIYECHTGQRATATRDASDVRAYSTFVDFVCAVNCELDSPLPLAGLGTAVRNFLYPRKGV